MAEVPFMLYRFNAIPTEIPTVLFEKVEKLIFKFLWSCMGPLIAKTILITKLEDSFFFKILFIFRGGGREREREGNSNV